MAMVTGDITFIDAPPWQVLVADDSSLWRHVTAAAIKAFGGPVIVHEAVDGGQALDILSRCDIDIAFIDLGMPEITGDEVVIRTGSLRRMPFFVVISGNTDGAEIARMRKLSAYDYLTKPFDAEAVSRVLKAYERASAPTSVLIIDDCVTTRAIIRRLLARTIFRLEVTDAGDGVAAFELYVKKPFDIVFLDVNMPGIDGEQTLRILRAYNPNVRVILMSGNQNSLDALKGYKARGYLRKPFGPSDLDALIHRVFGLEPPFITSVGVVTT